MITLSYIAWFRNRALGFNEIFSNSCGYVRHARIRCKGDDHQELCPAIAAGARARVLSSWRAPVPVSDATDPCPAVVAGVRLGVGKDKYGSITSNTNALAGVATDAYANEPDAKAPENMGNGTFSFC